MYSTVDGATVEAGTRVKRNQKQARVRCLDLLSLYYTCNRARLLEIMIQIMERACKWLAVPSRRQHDYSVVHWTVNKSKCNIGNGNANLRLE